MEMSGQQVLPSIRCSRNLRRRTGFLLGLEKTELAMVVGAGAIPGIIQKIFVIEHISILITAGVMAGTYLLIAMFKFGKQPNYPTLWYRSNFVHPNQWRAPQTRYLEEWPIEEDGK